MRREESVAGEVTFQMTAADHIAASRDYFRRAISRPRAWRAPAIAVILLFGIGFAMGRFLDNGPLAYQFAMGLWLAGCGLFALGLCYVLSYLMIPRRARRLFAQQKALHKPVRFAWSPEGVVQSTANGEGRYAWDDLYRWDEGRSTILLYHTERMYAVLPHRILEDDLRRDLIDTLSGSVLPRL